MAGNVKPLPASAFRPKARFGVQEGGEGENGGNANSSSFVTARIALTLSSAIARG